MMPEPSLKQRFQGCLLGLMLGDAVGALFEGQDAAWIKSESPTIDLLFNNLPEETLCYTDDTQMAIGIAETLVAQKEISEHALVNAFVANYEPHRGYGGGTRFLLEAMSAGENCCQIAEEHFPGGSYGNGAAMRVAPLGIFFQASLESVWEQARKSAVLTHTHPLGIEGAQLLAFAIALSSRMKSFDREYLYTELLKRATRDEYRRKLRTAMNIHHPQALGILGNSVQAIESVITAITCFSLSPYSYKEVIGNAVLLGGDTDTIAAMAGALSGAFCGLSSIPASLLNKLEDKTKGKTYVSDLADKLYTVSLGLRRTGFPS